MPSNVFVGGRTEGAFSDVTLGGDGSKPGLSHVGLCFFLIPFNDGKSLSLTLLTTEG